MPDRSDATWRKSTFCENGSCVEIAVFEDQVAIRDSKDEHGPMLLFTHQEWQAFLNGARGGEFDPSSR